MHEFQSRCLCLPFSNSSTSYVLVVGLYLNYCLSSVNTCEDQLHRHSVYCVGQTNVYNNPFLFQVIVMTQLNSAGFQRNSGR